MPLQHSPKQQKTPPPTNKRARTNTGGAASTPPVKTTDITEIFREINQKLAKLDKLDLLEQKIVSFETKLNDIQLSVQDLDVKCSAQVEVMEESVAKINSEMDALRGENRRLSEQILDIQTCSMRDNLVFFNIPETEDEVCETTVSNFLKDKLNLENPDRVKFERVHRMGQKRRGSHRPIVCKFSCYKDREEIRKAGPRLKGSEFRISEQFPREIQERRRKLMPLYRQARNDGKRAVLTGGRLYIDGVQQQLPEQQ